MTRPAKTLAHILAAAVDSHATHVFESAGVPQINDTEAQEG